MFLYGHSQGGNSVGFAAEILPEYAPELSLDGVVMAAPAALLETILELAYDGTITPYYGSGFLALAGISYESTYGLDPAEIVKPAYASDLLPIFTNVCASVGGLPLGINACAAVAELFLEDKGLLPPGTPLPPFATSELYIPLADYPAPWRARIAENSLGSRTIDAPVFIAQGCKDHTLPPAQSFEYFKEHLCAEGTPTQFQTYKGATHSGVLEVSTKDMIVWAEQVRRGGPPASNCASVTTVCDQEPDPKSLCALIPEPTPTPRPD